MAEIVEIKRKSQGHKGRFPLYVNGQYAGEMTNSSAGKNLLIIDHTAVDRRPKKYREEGVSAQIRHHAGGSASGDRQPHVDI